MKLPLGKKRTAKVFSEEILISARIWTILIRGHSKMLQKLLNQGITQPGHPLSFQDWMLVSKSSRVYKDDTLSNWTFFQHSVKLLYMLQGLAHNPCLYTLVPLYVMITQDHIFISWIRSIVPYQIKTIVLKKTEWFSK